MVLLSDLKRLRNGVYLKTVTEFVQRLMGQPNILYIYIITILLLNWISIFPTSLSLGPHAKILFHLRDPSLESGTEFWFSVVFTFFSQLRLLILAWIC